MAQDKNKLTQIIDRLDKSQKYKADFVEDWEYALRYYRGKYKYQMEGRANVFVPYTLATVESQLPRFIGNKPRVQYEARKLEYMKHNESINAKFEVDWHDGKSPLRIIDVAKPNLLLGYAAAFIPWAERRRRVREMVPGNVGFPDGEYYEQEIDKLFFAGPIIEPITPWRLFFDPEGYDVETCGWMAHAKRMSKMSIMRMIDAKYWNVPDEHNAMENLEKMDDHQRAFIIHYFEDEYSATLLHLNFTDGATLNFSKHGEANINDYQNITGSNGNYIMLDEMDLPFSDGEKPYVVARNIPLIEEFAAMGEAEIIRPQQKEINILRSTRLDNVNAAINRMWLVHHAANIDEDDLVVRPNGIITVKGLPLEQAMKELTVSDVKGAGVQEEQSIIRDIQIGSGMAETQMAQSTSRNERTATALLQASEAADVRIQMKVQHFELAFLEPLGNKFLARNKQFLTRREAFRKIGGKANDFFEVGPEEFAGEYTPIVHARSTEPYNRQVRMQEVTTFLNMLQRLPTVAERFEPGKLANEMAERFGMKDVPGLVLTEEEVQQRRQQAQAIDQAGQGGEGFSMGDINRAVGAMNG